jgi:hypothetical protein
MEPALAARYPEIKTYKVSGIDDPYASGRVDMTPRGFSGMLQTSRGRVFIDPNYASGQANSYVSRYRSSAQPEQGQSCGVAMLAQEPKASPVSAQKTAHRTPGSLLQYRLAVAATEEYVSAVYDSKLMDTNIDQAQAAIVVAINRVNEIYERDLGIKLMLVANNDQLIEDGGNVSFSNYDATTMIAENQDWIDKTIGNAAYDIGHVFSTGAGGLAFLGSTCDDPTKAKGVSGIAIPLGNPFYIDFVAHEIGHQFNAEHSFNGTTSACKNGRNHATAFEPGSGSSIMSYAGICDQENLQPHSDETFHAGSIAQIDSFTRSAGSCAVAVATNPAGNRDPTIAAIANKVIPANTPFVLDGNANDEDNVPTPTQALSYQWDQMDAGCPTDLNSFGTDNGSNALFRSYVPRGDSRRNFPALGTQVRGRFDKAEVLPCQNRDLDFRLTVRDGKSGQAVEDVRVSVDNTTGPFRITSIDPGSIVAGTAFEVIWDVADTDLPPINCSNVEFDLISFSAGYASYSIHPLVAVSNLNNGSEFVTLDPTIANPTTTPHLRSRVRVKCLGNIFYDLSDTDLTVKGTVTSPLVDLDDNAIAAYSFTNIFITEPVARACGAVVECAPPPVESSGSKGGGGGAIDYLWLLLMTGMIAAVKLFRRYGLQ